MNCARDREEIISRAVESEAKCDYPLFDIHMMDQSARPATRERVDELAVRFRSKVAIDCHHLDKAGVSRASNAGASVSDATLIAYTDDDVIVLLDLLTTLARAFTADPKPACFAVRCS